MDIERYKIWIIIASIWIVGNLAFIIVYSRFGPFVALYELILLGICAWIWNEEVKRGLIKRKKWEE